MKKLLAIVLAVLSAFSMTAVAYAENTTTLTTTVPDATYTLNIPADQEIAFGATSTRIGEITVTDSSGFAEGKNVQITSTWTAFESNEATTTIPFKLLAYGGQIDGISGSSRWVALNSGTPDFAFYGTDEGTVEKTAIIYDSNAKRSYVSSLYVDITSENWGKALGGDYSATITFTAEVVVED